MQRKSFKTDSGLIEGEKNGTNLGGLLHFSSLVFELRSARSENRGRLRRFSPHPGGSSCCCCCCSFHLIITALTATRLASNAGANYAVTPARLLVNRKQTSGHRRSAGEAGLRPAFWSRGSFPRFLGVVWTFRSICPPDVVGGRWG